MKTFNLRASTEGMYEVGVLSDEWPGEFCLYEDHEKEAKKAHALIDAMEKEGNDLVRMRNDAHAREDVWLAEIARLRGVSKPEAVTLTGLRLALERAAVAFADNRDLLEELELAAQAYAAETAKVRARYEVDDGA